MLGADDTLLIRRADDLIRLAALRKQTQFFGFLEERQMLLLTQYCSGLHLSNYGFFGGYEDASRRFFGVDSVEPPAQTTYPITMAEFSFRKQDVLSHRDFLGAFMAQGITRESVGDILVEQGRAVALLDEKIADFVCNQVEKIGRVGVKTQIVTQLSVSAQPKFQSMEGTVPSLRLDCVAGICTGLSREKTKALLLGKLVAVNAQLCQNPSALLREGDKLSVRGYGKFMLETVGGKTKKGRCYITIQKYV